MLHSVEVDLGGGRTLTIETGKMAKQANGAVIVRSGESVVLVTACTAPHPKVNASFFPLTVDYREYTYSAGRFMDLSRNPTGIYEVDFNRAYIPYCYYSPTYECPYPPRENRLQIPIRAGERMRKSEVGSSK